MACACGKKGCVDCGGGFCAPMAALWQVYDGIASKDSADLVSVAWEREEGKVFRYDLPVPKRLDPEAAKFVSHVVERILSSATRSTAMPQPTAASAPVPRG